jgi:hypothetical protein
MMLRFLGGCKTIIIIGLKSANSRLNGKRMHVAWSRDKYLKRPNLFVVFFLFLT